MMTGMTSRTIYAGGVQGEIVLKGLVGSHAYGLAHAGSDMDYQGIFMLPTTCFLGLKKFPETLSKTNGVDKTVEPDTTLHEVGKFIKLALDCNPTVSEVLWLEGYEILRPEVVGLIENRQRLLSQLVRAKYVGYARSQFKRMDDPLDIPELRKARVAKNARHLARLVFQARHILATGEIRLRLTDDEIAQCRWLEALCLQDRAKFNDVAERMMLDVGEMPSNLREKPDLDFAHDMLVTIREWYR